MEESDENSKEQPKTSKKNTNYFNLEPYEHAVRDNSNLTHEIVATDERPSKYCENCKYVTVKIINPTHLLDYFFRCEEHDIISGSCNLSKPVLDIFNTNKFVLSSKSSKLLYMNTYETEDDFGTCLIQLCLTSEEVKFKSTLEWAKRCILKSGQPYESMDELLEWIDAPILDFNPSAHMAQNNTKLAIRNLKEKPVKELIIDFNKPVIFCKLEYTSYDTKETDISTYDVFDLCTDKEICGKCDRFGDDMVNCECE